MKSSCKAPENCQVKLTVTLDADEMNAIVKDVEKTFLREAQIPGFRKGKVPLQIVRKEFAAQLKEEISRAMVRKYYKEAVTAEKLEEITCVGFESITHDEKGGEFVALVDVRPTFKLPTYKGLKISSKDTTIKDADVKAQIDRLRVGYATYEDAKEGETIADGDYVAIDYEGMVGKKKILEINPEAKIVGEGKNFWTQVEEGRFLPEILDALKGMKIGETKDGIKTKFDKETAPEGLKGAKAVYTVTVTNFRRRVLPDDAKLVEKTKSESIEKLQATIRESLEKNAVEQEAKRRENEAIELLMKKVDFDVPGCLVQQATEAFLKDFARRAQYSGLDANYFEQHREEILKNAVESATNQIRLGYIIDAIAKKEKLEASEKEKGEKVFEFILANAKK